MIGCILVIAALTILCYIYFKKPFTYWSQKNVPQTSPLTQLVNTVRGILLLKPHAETVTDMYNLFPDARYYGAYQFSTPVLVLRDPELIKEIMVKNFDRFTDHNTFFPEDIEPLWGKNLFALKGDRWRDMRATLSPSFTSSKMKGMFVLMNECAQQFVDHFSKNKTVGDVEMQDAFTRFTNDTIASTAFGVTCNSLTDRNNEFYLMGKEVTNAFGFWNLLKIFAFLLSPKIPKILGLTLFSNEVRNFFRRLVKSNIESREKSGIVRHDMIHLLVDAKKGRLKHDHEEEEDSEFAVIKESAVGKDENRVKRPLTDDDLTAQVFIFFLAGFESVSTLMCFGIYEITINTEVQETLRREVDETFRKCGGHLTYEALLKMKYMDMVISETLRKWPPQVVMDRICVQPHTIQPLSEEEKPVYIDKDVMMFVPVFGMHRDPQIYPNPDRFDPERFSDENKTSLNSYAYLPFGTGPRSCIGNRFALLETKTILYHIILNFEVAVSEKTGVPIKLARRSFNLQSDDGFWFKLKPRVH